jgi:hypothetical protein
VRLDAELLRRLEERLLPEPPLGVHERVADPPLHVAGHSAEAARDEEPLLEVEPVVDDERRLLVVDEVVDDRRSRRGDHAAALRSR